MLNLVFHALHFRVESATSNASAGDFFGSSISISGDTLAVGASSSGEGSTGEVYVFTRSGGDWVQQALLKASTPGANDLFGSSVSISGDTLAVGALLEDSSGTGINSGLDGDNLTVNSGAVYVFTRNAGEWSLQAYIKASNTDAGDQFGSSVSISGDTLAVGAIGEDSSGTGINSSLGGNNLAMSSGAVYVFTRNAREWSQQAYIKASNTDVSDNFGSSVSISGDTLAIGAPLEDSSAISVSIDGTGETDNFTENSGAVYIFHRSDTDWFQEAYIKPFNTDADDIFGLDVSMSNDYLAVSAVGEDSNGSGINGGSQLDNSNASSGAVYVFSRKIPTWVQKAYIKAFNSDAGDVFGSSISLNGENLAVSAVSEGSDGTGVNNGSEGVNNTPSSGAAYIFSLVGPAWVQQAYIKPSNTDSNDEFGNSVSILGDTLVVSAPGEDSGGVSQGDNSFSDAGAVYTFQ